MPEGNLSSKVCTYQEACQLRRINGDGPLHCELLAELKGIAMVVSSGALPAMLHGYQEVIAEIAASASRGCAQPIEVAQRANQVQSQINQTIK